MKSAMFAITSGLIGFLLVCATADSDSSVFTKEKHQLEVSRASEAVAEGKDRILDIMERLGRCHRAGHEDHPAMKVTATEALKIWPALDELDQMLAAGLIFDTKEMPRYRGPVTDLVLPSSGVHIRDLLDAEGAPPAHVASLRAHFLKYLAARATLKLLSLGC